MTRRLVALIPARSGSKRLPGKNILPLAGLPLIAWTIRSALSSGAFSEVLVSTDDKDIAAVAVQHGASVPWLRPLELSTDTATSIDVVLHAMTACESAGQAVDSLMLLQPTSPFRSPDLIANAVSLHEKSGYSPVVSVCPAKAHPHWCFQLSADGSMESYGGRRSLATRSQDLPPAYQLNGSLYLAAVQDLRQERTFLTSNTKALVTYLPEESIDIDDAWDWRIAECFAATLPVG